MPIPDYQTLMLPLLSHISDKCEHTVAAARNAIADQFDLTELERKERLPSGTQNKFGNRLAWAKTYLERAGLITMVKRGVFVISPKGLVLLESPPERITIEFLKRYPEFAEFRKAAVDENSVSTTESDESANGTPEEQLEHAHSRIRNSLGNELLALILNSPPSFFEKLVVDLMLRMGFGGPGDESGIVTSYGNDEGIDGIINEDALGLEVIYLQAKRYSNTVGRPDIQKFVGALHGRRARKGVFLTTSSFSAGARDYVKAIDPRVILIDGAKLCQLMIDYGVGVSTERSYDIKKVDSDYFDD
ncbi:MAG: restriction endonuclease [Rhodopirellula sp. TMED11]|nr:MAG: restriction endonuclease [Rhodopirellula sp. TMED11]